MAYPTTVDAGGNFSSTVDTGLGHLLATYTGSPTLSSINANVTSTSVSGNDVRGVFSFNTQTGTISAATAFFTVTFNLAFTSIPVIVLTNANNQTTTSWYCTDFTTSSFIVRNAASVPVSTGFKINYIVIG